jgi:hypothetical protein
MMRAIFFGALIAATSLVSSSAKADPFMSMMDSANYSGVQFAGTLMINGAIDSSAGGGSRVTQAQVDAQNRDLKLLRACKNPVFKRTQVGPERQAALKECDRRYPVKMPADYPRDGGFSSQPRSTSVAPNMQSGQYRASMAITKGVQNEFYATVKAGSPPTAEEIRTKLFNQDIEKLFGTTVRPFGLRSNDLVDSVTAYWVSMWIIANQAPNPTNAQIRAVRSQVQMGMAQSGALRKSDADKQRLSQMMMYETILGLVALNTNSINKAALAKATAQNMKRRGMDMTRMRIGPAGFVRV